MSDLDFTIRHGRTKREACACLAAAVGQAWQHFGALLHRADWSAGDDSVRLSGVGFEIDASADEQQLRISGRAPLFGRLFAAPLALGLKRLAERALEDRSESADPPAGDEA